MPPAQSRIHVITYSQVIRFQCRKTHDSLHTQNVLYVLRCFLSFASTVYFTVIDYSLISDFENLSAMPICMINISAEFHQNASTNYTEISCHSDGRTPDDGRTTDLHDASRRLLLAAES